MQNPPYTFGEFETPLTYNSEVLSTPLAVPFDLQGGTRNPWCKVRKRRLSLSGLTNMGESG